MNEAPIGDENYLSFIFENVIFNLNERSPDRGRKHKAYDNIEIYSNLNERSPDRGRKLLAGFLCFTRSFNLNERSPDRGRKQNEP